MKPTPTSRMLIRNGTRQPQLKKSASGSCVIRAKIPVEAATPTGKPICTRLP
ncbi:hypothetical protein ABIB08_005917 [Bradyrhizobium sp. RT11b]